MAQEKVIVEVGGRRFRAVNRHPSGWWIHTEGLDAWWDSPDTRFDEDLIPGQHGAFDPDEVLLGARSFPFIGRHEASSAAWAEREVRTWAAALAPQTDLGVRVFVADRWLRLRDAKIRGRVRVREVTETICEFHLPIWSADPLKYGPVRQDRIEAALAPAGGLTFPVVDGALDFGGGGTVTFPGAFRITNPGTAPFFPTFRAHGYMQGFTITSESNTVQYSGTIGAGSELVASPYMGGRAVLDGTDVSFRLVQADWAPIGPGESRGFLFTPVNPGRGAQLIAEYPEGAWF